MNSVSFTITKTAVYNEVAKTTSYGGKKAQEDGSAYERMRTTPEDEELLARFWTEACDVVTSIVRPFLVSVSDASDYSLELSLPARYDTALNDTLQDTVFSLIVNIIISSWYGIANKEEEAKYTGMATGLAAKVRSTVYYRKKPKLVQTESNDTQQS